MYNEKRVKMFFFKKKEKISEYKIRKEKSMNFKKMMN